MQLLLQFLGFFRKDCWLWTSKDPSSSDSWDLIKNSCYRLSPESDRIWLRPTRAPSIRPGWYLFAITHTSNNNRAVGWARCSQFGFRQGRPIYPIRKRLRVVRINRARCLTIELQFINDIIQIDQIYLKRISFVNAKRRILRRISKFQDLETTSTHKNWRIYNNLLNAQAGKYEPLPYQQWISKVETKLVEANSLSKAYLTSNFSLQYPSRLSRVKHDDWVILLRPGSQIAEFALPVMSAALNNCAHKTPPKVFYGDEDSCGNNVIRHSPCFKTVWNNELFWANPQYSSHWVIAGDIWNAILNDFRITSDTDWWTLQYSLIAFLKLNKLDHCIAHLPFILSHVVQKYQRPHPSLPEKFLAQLHDEISSPVVSENTYGFTLQWNTPVSSLLSIIIPTRDHLDDLNACLSSIERFKAGCDYEIIIADNDSAEHETISFLDNFASKGIGQVIRVSGAFNYSYINNEASKLARGEALLLLNNDVEFISSDWGKSLLTNALRPGIGCVGAQLLYPDQTIQHAGVILGIGGMASHAHRDYASDSPGYSSRLQLTQEFSAVTAACLSISRENWFNLGGLDAAHLAVNYNDVDLCLRSHANGLKNIYLPSVRAIHHESKSRGRPKGSSYLQWRSEWAVMERRWGQVIANDPYYSPFLTLEDESWNLAYRLPNNIQFRY